MSDNDSNERHMIRHLHLENQRLNAFLAHDQWSIIDRAIQRYSAGEISDLHALGLVAAGFLKLDEARAALVPKPAPNDDWNATVEALIKVARGDE